MSYSTEAYRLLIAEVYDLAGRSRSTSDQFSKRHGQSVARWHVLSVLLDGPRTVPEIAGRLGLQRQSVQRVVNELHADGLVEFAANPDHSRSRLVATSEGGAKMAQALFAESSSARARTLEAAGLTSAELDRARGTLERLSRALTAGDQPADGS